jgi:hypothetical protein
MAAVTDLIDEAAARSLPCRSRPAGCLWTSAHPHLAHSINCPAFYRPAVAAEMRSRDAMLTDFANTFSRELAPMGWEPEQPSEAKAAIAAMAAAAWRRIDAVRANGARGEKETP